MTEKSGVLEKTTSTILTPDGGPARVPTVILSTDEAELLRQYKTFLATHGLREALYCQTCWTHDLADGTNAYVTSQQIVIRCRCRLLFFQGTTR